MKDIVSACPGKSVYVDHHWGVCGCLSGASPIVRTALQTLSLQGCRMITDASIRVLISGLSNLQVRTHWWMRPCFCSVRHAMHTLAGTCRASTLAAASTSRLRAHICLSTTIPMLPTLLELTCLGHISQTSALLCAVLVKRVSAVTHAWLGVWACARARCLVYAQNYVGHRLQVLQAPGNWLGIFRGAVCCVAGKFLSPITVSCSLPLDHVQISNDTFMTLCGACRSLRRVRVHWCQQLGYVGGCA